MQYFSDRELGELPREIYEVSSTVWQGIAWQIQKRNNKGLLGDVKQFEAEIYAEIPALLKIPRRYSGSSNQTWDITAFDQPPLHVTMDVIEFCWKALGDRAPYRKRGQESRLEFEEDINRIFRRNLLAFNITKQGTVERTLLEVVGNAIRYTAFQTGDVELDGLLETACQKFLVPEENGHRDALEKLWDAWERLKTIEDSAKKTGVTKILDATADSSQPKFRNLLEKEARVLTDVGNYLRIRHSETTVEPLVTLEQIDYLFQRMFSLMHLILRATGRVG